MPENKPKWTKHVKKGGQKRVKKCPKWVIFGVIFETPKIIILPSGAA